MRECAMLSNFLFFSLSLLYWEFNKTACWSCSSRVSLILLFPTCTRSTVKLKVNPSLILRAYSSTNEQPCTSISNSERLDLMSRLRASLASLSNVFPPKFTCWRLPALIKIWHSPLIIPLDNYLKQAYSTVSETHHSQTFFVEVKQLVQRDRTAAQIIVREFHANQAPSRVRSLNRQCLREVHKSQLRASACYFGSVGVGWGLGGLSGRSFPRRIFTKG